MATNRGTDSPETTRSARFKRHGDTEMPPTDVSGRRAAFRPPEATAVRRDVVEAMRQSALSDVHLITDSAKVKQRAMTTAALADDALGRPDKAISQYGKIRREFDLNAADWAIQSRILRDSGDLESQIDVLRRAAREGGETASLFAFEAAYAQYIADHDPKDVLTSLNHATTQSVYDLPVTVAWRAATTTADVLAETGKRDEALEVVEQLIDHPKLPNADKIPLKALAGFWAHVLRDSKAAASILAEVSIAGSDDDTHQSAAYFSFEAGEREVAIDALGRCETLAPENDVVLGLENFGEHAPNAADDAVVAHWRSEHFDSTHDRQSLIDELCVFLEDDSLDPATRTFALHRLGRLYEQEADLQEAAAEVYREALELEPDNATVLRALGRIYARQGNFQMLAALFEREIKALEGAPSVWRRHFQVAEIYETRCGEPGLALDHFKAALAYKPNYLPALKGAARVMGQQNRHAELADLFLASVTTATSRRQKLYLLDKVAHVAEHHLHNVEVAIGAWEEILHLAPDHPQAFSALGRLYAGTNRWNALVSLNVRELEQIEDNDERAALLVRNAEIALSHLGETEQGERYLHEALSIVPDFLPALELLGRLYSRSARWNGILEMTAQQIANTHDKREKARLMGSMAEVFEQQLNRAEDALAMYRQIIEVEPLNAQVVHSWLRLATQTQNWTEVAAAMKKLVALTRAPLWIGALAQVNELKLGKSAAAYVGYLKALEMEPGNRHWLAGIGRTWADASVNPGELATHLEHLTMATMSSECRDAYFLMLARLKERATGCPDAARAFRAHGDQTHPENQAVLRLSMASSSERKQLVDLRVDHPLCELERVLTAHGATFALEKTRDSVAHYLTDILEDDERAFFIANMPPEAANEHTTPEDAWQLVIATSMASVLADDAVIVNSNEVARLRAIQARESDVLEDYSTWMRDEIDASDSQEQRVLRFVEWADVDRGRAATLLREAVEQAFPADNGVTVQDSPCLDRLYDALEAQDQYELLRFALETHVTFPEISDARRAYLFAKLANVLEEHLSDFGAARTAFLQCWQITENPGFLTDLVRVATGAEDVDAAVRYQSTHYETMVHSETADLEDRVASALRLSELMVEANRGDEAVRLLEDVAHFDGEDEVFYNAKRQLARLHVEYGDSSRAASLLQEILPFKATEDSLEDWRTLVRLNWFTFEDLSSAYSLQWKLVRALPDNTNEVDQLIELAIDLDELQDCCKQLEAFAEDAPRATKIAILGRAAESIDEDVNWPEEAARLYRELISLTKGDMQLHYRRRLGFALSRVAGRETEALSTFRELATEEPFEPSTYRGLVELSDRVHAHDRARVARDILNALGCEVEQRESGRVKVSPSRALSPESAASSLLPKALQNGVFDVLRQTMPLADKTWADALPQRKALQGEKVRDSKVLGYFADGFALFGFKRVKVMEGDSIDIPLVFNDSTPEVWISNELLTNGSAAELRFVAGWAAALAWSQMASLTHVDGRQVWHLAEGAVLKQTGQGFSDRVDAQSQDFAMQLSGPFHAVTRRRIASAVEACEVNIHDVHCEAWPEAIRVMAARAGLICCGNVVSALGASLKVEGWLSDLADTTSQKRLRNSAIVEDLIAFALSDDFLQLRYEVGLSGRPSKLPA